jgi:beta-glucosidase
MVALNAVNGVPATADKWLLQDLLRKQWGFTGMTISDHGAILELIKHGVAADGRDAARLAIRAGIDLSMDDKIYDGNLGPLLESGKISMSDIDRACRDVLRVKYDLGLFRDAYKAIGKAGDDPADPYAEERLHRPAARQVARESLVLLKNDRKTLPLSKRGVIAVVGPLADSQHDIIGNWAGAGRHYQAVTLLAGMRKAVGDKARILYARGSNISDDPALIGYLNLYSEEVEADPRKPDDLHAEAVEAARQADVVVAAVGEAQGMAHEASSRSDIILPPVQTRWKPGSPAPRAATPSPTCSPATPTRRASCP